VRSLIIKTRCDHKSVRVTLGDPRVEPSNNEDWSLQLRRINNIPDNISSSRVLTDFKNTIDATAYTQTGARMEFDYSELGAGKLIK